MLAFVSQGVANNVWFLISLDILMVLFYSFAIVLAYYAYREYKGMHEDAGNAKYKSPMEFGATKGTKDSV